MSAGNDSVLLAVNGGLMRGFPANARMVEADATFVRDDRTAPRYRLWSIDDRFPGMMRATTDRRVGESIALEIWSLSPAAFVSVIEAEPRGLTVGRVELADGSMVLGVLAEPWLCEGRREITGHGGWRAWLDASGADNQDSSTERGAGRQGEAERRVSGDTGTTTWRRRIATLLGSRAEPRSRALSLRLDALREDYADGQRTVAEVVAHCLARISQLDWDGPRLRAMITVNPRVAEEARALDGQSPGGRPLYGVPVVIKDNIEVADLPVTGGSAALADLIAERDAVVVARLRAAGAVIMGKTSLSEFAWGTWDTENSIIDGPARNPHAPAYATGGSSGGTAAAIAAGYATMGLGTDTGCSIRAPAAVNALVGLRPTHGSLEMDGIMPMNADWDTVGPMAPTVAELAVLFDVMRGDARGACAAALKGGADSPRVGVVRHLIPPDDSHPEVRAAFDRCVADLADAGIEAVDPLAAGVFSVAFDAQAWYMRFRQDLDGWLAARAARAPVNSLAAILATGKVHSRYIAKLMRLRDWPHTPETQPGRDDMIATRDRYRAVFDDLFKRERLDALVFPTFRYPPVLNGTVPTTRPGQLAPVGSNNYYASLTGYPALSVPMGWTEAGLPLGLQLLGPPGSEERLLAVAHCYEQATRHGRLAALG